MGNQQTQNIIKHTKSPSRRDGARPVSSINYPRPVSYVKVVPSRNDAARPVSNITNPVPEPCVADGYSVNSSHRDGARPVSTGKN